ncbi:tail fiber domain-containing protein [Streptomyces sp. NPDC001407]|uniref:tail fiber domain-containing protein n=1 Tax=Streptomyces sp. NPDC001407 TaxID=3364573 RepID=UPI00367872E8
MAITSYPFDGQSVTESQFSQLFREFVDSGIAASAWANAFQVSADGAAMSVKVQPGFAIVRGHAVLSTAVETLPIAAAGTSTRYDRVALRLDPAANSITLTVVQGAAGGSAPAMTQTDTGIYELPLATVTVGANITAVTSAAVSGDRRFVGQSVGAWVTTTRPVTPRLGKLGLNYDTSVWEFWNGTAWTPLVASVSWSSLTGKPATFSPSSHSHQWSDITDPPVSLPPSAHKHPWGDITGTPSTYPPATHSHSWSSISDKPSTFPPSSHSHGSYLESGDTIAWSNGTKRAHSSSVSGSGTYYAVWVNGSGQFCRNTSSRRFKQNIRDIDIAPEAVLSLRPRVYDRRPDETGGDYARGEFGLIAEEAAETLPEIVTYDEEGRIDALRYDLLSVALLPVVQDQAARIERLEALVEEMSRAS